MKIIIWLTAPMNISSLVTPLNLVNEFSEVT
jgi:hypothetical protein